MELCTYDLDKHIHAQITEIEPCRWRRRENSRPQFLKQTKEMLHIAAEIATGLAYIHNLSEVHRNLKPKNRISLNASHTDSYEVLFSARDSKWKVTDFGFSVEESIKRDMTDKASGGTVGSYRAPELLRVPRQYHSSPDMWAMGCIFYEMMTQSKAFQDDRTVKEYPDSMPPLTIYPPTGRGIPEMIARAASLNSIVGDLCPGLRRQKVKHTKFGKDKSSIEIQVEGIVDVGFGHIVTVGTIIENA